MLIELPCPIPYVPFMNHDNYPNDYIRGILNSVKTIALVGASQNPARPSWIVTKYLLERGYDVIPVNPGLAGQELLGKRVYPQTVGVAPDWVRPRPGDERLYLLDDYSHRPASVPADRIPPPFNAGLGEASFGDKSRARHLEAVREFPDVV